MFSLAWTVLFWEAEGALAITSLEFEYLHRKSRCKMLIGGDDISNVITLGTCLHVFFNVCLHLRSFLLLADWRKSDNSVDGESQGNWRRNSNSRDVVANSSSFSRLAGYVFFDAMYERCICCTGYLFLITHALLTY